jgi:outer membrane protein OmpA-like peptidoglycan-associated protein
MTKLTSLFKVLLGLILGGAIVAAIHTYRDRLQGLWSGSAAAPTAGSPPAGPPPVRKSGQTIVALAEWPGHMPLVIGNGGLTTQAGSSALAEGLDLKIVFIDDPAKRVQGLVRGEIDAVWSTVDEQPILLGAFRKANVEVKTFLQLDWSRGGDACVVAPEITKVEDIIGRKAAMLMFSPDHTLFEFMITNSRITREQIARLRSEVSFTMDDVTYARKQFVERKVDVACVWEPEVTLAITSRPGAHRLFSTAEATDLIADVLLVRQDFLDNKPAQAERIARVWFEGIRKGNADRAAAARFISTTVPRFRDELGQQQTLKGLDWVRWTDLADNASFFGLDGSQPAFDRVYNHADSIWINYPQAEIRDRFAPATVRDDRIIRRVWESTGRKGVARAPKYQEGTALTGTALFTKPISINFRAASVDLDAEGMSVLNSQLLPQLEIARGMYVRIEGNSDSAGKASSNQRLSELRAKAIADFLVSRGIDRARIVARGNGASRPVASNKTPEGRAQNRRTDILFIPAKRGS